MKTYLDIVIYVASVLVAVGTISGFIVKWLNKKLTEIIKPVKDQIHMMDVKECRRFIIDFLIDIENGKQKNEVQWKFAHDVYDHYTMELKENSYVKDFWERVVINGHNE